MTRCQHSSLDHGEQGVPRVPSLHLQPALEHDDWDLLRPRPVLPPGSHGSRWSTQGK